jgi:folylpolyglutamate synthase
MPWVRPVDPRVLRETVTQLFRPASLKQGAPSDIPNEFKDVEIRIFENDTNDTNTPEPPHINTSEGFNRPLVDALRWAAARHRPAEAEDPASHRGLVVLAGSLYLVADLYRLLEGGFGSRG